MIITKPPNTSIKELGHNKILILIAVYKFLKALACIIAGIALLKIVHVDLILMVQRYIDQFHIDPRSQGVEWVLRNVAGLGPRQITLFAFGIFAYAVLFIVEGVGLYFEKVWAEWLVIVEVAAFCPLEVIEIQRYPQMWHILIFVINVLIVFYLFFLRLWAIQRNGDKAGMGKKTAPVL